MTATESRRIGALLVENRLITASQLEQALQQQESTGARLGEIVVAEFGVSQDELSRVLVAEGRDPGDTELRERRGHIPLGLAASQQLSAAEVRLRRPIGEIFVELGFITEGQLESALAVQKTTGARIGEILVEQGILTRLDLASALAEHWESGQPAPAAAGRPSGNGAPVAPPPERTQAADDDPAITDFEHGLTDAEEALEPARPARRAWRRRGRSTTVAGAPSPAPGEEGAADPATPGSLDVKIEDLGRLLESLEASRADDALATAARLATVEAAIESLAGLETRVREGVQRDLAERPEALAPRLELLENRLDTVTELEKRVAVLSAATVEIGAELRALTERPVVAEPGEQILELARRIDSTASEGQERVEELAEELRADVQSRITALGSALEAHQKESAALLAQIGEIQQVAAGAEESTAALRVETTSLGARIDELQELRHADAQAVRAANERLDERLEAHSVRSEGDAEAARAAAGALEGERALRAELLGGLGRIEASLGQRLELIEESLASDDRAGLEATVAELGRRLDEQAAIAEEQSRASERAIRKGLASLGKRLAGPEPKHARAGKGRRRSIERLGAAVVEADARMADQIPAAEAEGCVAFAPTEAGYRLVELPGGPPEIGSGVELDGCDGPLVVLRYGRSPLPFDSRPCAYLGRD